MGLPFYITAVINRKPDTTEVVVHNEIAKLVQVSPQKKVWFAFTNKPACVIDIMEMK